MVLKNRDSSLNSPKNRPDNSLTQLERRLELVDNEFRETRIEFERILDLMTHGVRIINRDHSIRAVNKAFADMFGVDPREAVGMECYRVFPSAFCHTDQCRLVRILNGEEQVTTEIQRMRRDGSSIPCVITAIPLKNSSGEITGIIETLRDLSLRRHIQAQLAESEDRYKALINLGTEVGEAVVMLQDLGGVEALQTFVSDEWPRITGYSKDELLKMSFVELVAPSERDASLSRHRLKMSGKTLRGLFEIGITRKDGTLVPVELTSAFTMYRGQRANVAYIRDISERKKTESEFKKQATLLQAQLDASIDGIMIVDPDGHRLLQNRSVNRIWGINPDTPGDTTRQDRLSLIAARTKSPSQFRETVMRLANDPVAKIRDEIDLVDGKIIERYSAPVTGADGKRYGRIWNFHDVTESKQVEHALKESEKFYRTLFENTGTATSLSEADTTIVLVNTEFETLSGFTKAELEGKKRWTEFIPPADLPQAMSYANQISADPAAVPNGFEMRFVDRQKRIKNVIVTVNQIPGGTRRIASIKDITRRQKAEKDLKKSRQRVRDLLEHVEMVREEERKRIAQEMHDELGQLLTALKMDVVWLSKRLPQEDPAVLGKATQMRQTIDMTIQSIKRISAELRPHLLDNLGISAAIEWQLKQIAEVTGLDCSFVSHPADIVTDSASSVALFRIFQETITNAVRHSNASRVVVKLDQLSERVCLSVEDNGVGIKHSAITDAKSFGLISIKERAHVLGGSVEISGKPGKGTTVVADIPAHNKEVGHGKDINRR
jgi:PAS domain S-box-containing protein